MDLFVKRNVLLNAADVQEVPVDPEFVVFAGPEESFDDHAC